jgi:hypothetical protein
VIPRPHFPQDDSLSFPALKQLNLPSGRVYVVEGTETVLPSITRVLGAKPKPQLIAWRQRVGKDEADRVSQFATSQGTEFHGVCEAYLRNQPLPSFNPLTAELWQYMRPWLARSITRVYAQEQAVYSLRLGTSGTFDLLADVDCGDGPVFSVVDFKTSKKPKRDDWVEDYYMQGTFYACAVYELTGRAPKQIVFPIANPTGLQLFISKPALHFDALRERIEYFYDSLDTPLALSYN